MHFKHILTLFFIINVSILLAQPTPDFSATPLEACVGEVITFTDLSTSNNTITGWSWDFGDGNSSTDQNPTHIYQAAANYTVILSTTDVNGTSSEVKFQYLLIHPNPVPSFTIPSIGCTVPYDLMVTGIQPNSAGFSYSWNFGNGQTFSTMQPTGIQYTSEGQYNVTLEVTNTTTGCNTTETETITITDYSADFTFPATICENDVVAFTDASIPGTNQWSWNFAGQGTSSQQNPSFSFNGSGDFNVTLTSSNTTTGCSNSITQAVTVLPLPTPSFNADPLAGCSPLTVDFTNTTLDPGNFTWNFGNGNTSNDQNPTSQIYTSNGSHDVTLSMTDINGCVSSVTMQDLIIVSPLIPNLTADVTEGCEVLDVQFSDLSQSPDPTFAPITQWQWDFGNGQTFSGQNPPVQQYSEGVYTVTLTVTTDAGCTETLILTDTIQVGIPPVVDFTVDHNLDCAKQDFVFTNLTTISIPFDPSEVEYNWDFGDGGSSTQEHPTYNYPVDTGFFDVSLIVSFRGCPDTLTLTDYIYINAPISRFQIDPSVFCNPTFPVQITASDNAIIGAEPDDVQMIWTWGDGQTDILEDAALYDSDQGTMTHSYSSAGTYTVKQVIHNFTTGCSDSTEQQVSFSTIDASGTYSSDSICVFGNVNFASTSSSSHPIISTVFQFGNGQSVVGTNANVTYPISGRFFPQITITNSLGCTDVQILDSIEVLALPIAQISPSDIAGCAPLDVIYTNTSTSTGNGVGLTEFNWTFPDNSTETTNLTSEQTNYLITTQGNFTTTLVAIDEFGCVSTPTPVTTTITLPIPNFNYEPIVCNNEDVLFTNTSFNDVSSEWFIDDVAVGNTNNLTHTFTDPTNLTTFSNVHEIQLIVTDANGCVDSITQLINVSTPFASASYNFTGGNVNVEGEFVCPPVFAEFTDESQSIGNITTYSWDFGDGKFSSEQSPDNTYVFAGVYTATMEIIDQYGCTDDTVYFEYLEIGGPQGDVSWNSIGDVCSPIYEFVPENLVNVSTIVWTLGDGTILESTTSFEHEYLTQGSYTPTVSIQDNNGCEVPVELPLITIVNSDLNALFEFSPETAEVTENVSINDLSTGGFNGIVDWEWTVEDNTFNNGGSFNYAWQTPGNHVVTLIVTDEAGCVDTYTNEIFITADVEVPNVFTPNGDGVNDEFILEFPAFKEFEIVILNRWGNVIHHGKSQQGIFLWNGKTLQGTLCTEGVYFYKLEGLLFDDTTVSKHGFVTLKY